MGKPAMRLGDMSVGHGFPPTATIKSSTDVFANGKGIVRQGDTYALHCQSGSCHQPTAAKASTTVKVNGKGLHRTGDKLSCGDTAGQGSTTVKVGG